MRPGILLIVFTLTVAACRQGPGRAARADAAEPMLTAMEGRLAALIDAGDTAGLGALLAPEFALVGQDTTRRVARAVWIANTARLSFDSVHATVREVVMRGDSAQVALELRFQIVGLGVAPASELYELADTWVHRDAGWQLTRRRLLMRRTTPRPVSIAKPECRVYATALRAAYPDSQAKQPVLMDSTFNRVFQNAFNAWTTMRPPTTGPGASISSVTLDSLRAANPDRVPLPTCAELRSYRFVASDTLKSLFSGTSRTSGWDRFYQSNVGASGFTGLSRVAFNTDSTEAVMYLSHHADWLNGYGVVFRLRMTNGEWIVSDRRVVWRS